MEHYFYWLLPWSLQRCSFCAHLVPFFNAFYFYSSCIDRFCTSRLYVLFQIPVALYQCLLGCSLWPYIVVYFPWYTYSHHLISSMMLLSVIMMGIHIFYGWGGGGLSHSPPTPLFFKETYTSVTVLTFDQRKGCIIKHINNISNQYFDHCLLTVCNVVTLKSFIHPEPWAWDKTLNTSYK